MATQAPLGFVGRIGNQIHYRIGDKFYVRSAPGKVRQTKANITKNGYLYIWVSNETQGWDMFIDNLSVQYKQGPLLEENHYYPFGLSMQGISDKALKTSYIQNKYRYSGKELQNQEFSDASGLEEYDFGWRFQDPQLGIWHNIDPLAENTPSISPYVYIADNPISLIDPDGRTISGDTSSVKKLENSANDIKKSEEAKEGRLQKRIDKKEAKGKNTDRLQRKNDII